MNRVTSADLITVMGAMYGATLFLGINNCSTVQPVVSVERTVFYRERAAGMYAAMPYAFSQVSALCVANIAFAFPDIMNCIKFLLKITWMFFWIPGFHRIAIRVCTDNHVWIYNVFA